MNVAGNPAGIPLVFIHGFGCDQNMWRYVTPAFEADYKIVLLDLAGSGHSNLSKYDRKKYARLDGHAVDILDICQALQLEETVLVGHSVSAMIAALAANREPNRVRSIIMVGPSPSYINDGEYVGGFTREDIDGLIEALEANYLGWSSNMAPLIMGSANPEELGAELTASFCRTDPDIAAHFARTTFLSNHRTDVRQLKHPCLVLQCSDDAIAPMEVGRWLERNIQDCELAIMKATGHCPHISAPEETVAAMKKFLESQNPAT